MYPKTAARMALLNTGLNSAKLLTQKDNVDYEILTEKNRFYRWITGTCCPAKKGQTAG